MRCTPQPVRSSYWTRPRCYGVPHCTDCRHQRRIRTRPRPRPLHHLPQALGPRQSIRFWHQLPHCLPQRMAKQPWHTNLRCGSSNDWHPGRRSGLCRNGVPKGSKCWSFISAWTMARRHIRINCIHVGFGSNCSRTRPQLWVRSQSRLLTSYR